MRPIISTTLLALTTLISSPSFTTSQTLAPLEPATNKTLLAFWLDLDPTAGNDDPAAANKRISLNIPVFQFAFDIPGSLQPANQDKSVYELVKETGTNAGVYLTLYPRQGFDKVDDAAVKTVVDFVKDLNSKNVSVWVRYAPEMNGDWLPYAQQPQGFRDSWKKLYTALHGASDSSSNTNASSSTNSTSKLGLRRRTPTRLFARQSNSTSASTTSTSSASSSSSSTQASTSISTTTSSPSPSASPSASNSTSSTNSTSAPSQKNWNVAMVFSPNMGYTKIANITDSNSQNFKLLDTNGDGKLDQNDDFYSPYWPGDEYVDWVGMSIYHFGYEQPNLDNIPTPQGYVETTLNNVTQPFYSTYASGKNKPMMISETGAPWNPDTGKSEGSMSEVDVKRSFWKQFVTNETFYDHFPNVKLICWFEISKKEDVPPTPRVRDFRISNNTQVLDALKSDVAAVIGNNTSDAKSRFIWASNNTSSFIVSNNSGNNGTSTNGTTSRNNSTSTGGNSTSSGNGGVTGSSGGSAPAGLPATSAKSGAKRTVKSAVAFGTVVLTVVFAGCRY
ncbi:hypothetical protein HDV00_003649 [Rhizophlyctis rosea]|nr:hypothetical protein HDV00_003649 [Rhizophlyctis rosea]